jgi:hypothetical protein
VPEGLSPAEVGKEIAEHREHVEHQEQAVDEHGGHHVQHDRLISVIEAALLSLVALLAAWSGYSAAKWGSHSSLLLAQASSARSESSLAEIQATQIRTLDSVSFNAVEVHTSRTTCRCSNSLSAGSVRVPSQRSTHGWHSVRLRTPTLLRIPRTCRSTESRRKAGQES